MKALMIAAVVMLGGCAGGYYSDVPPTVDSVEAAGGVQIYKGTAYLPSDFKPSGELRAFGDYDFMVESAPCTAAGNGLNPGANDSAAFILRHPDIGGGSDFVYSCRSSLPHKRGNRLLMVGSAYDCADTPNGANYHGKILDLTRGTNYRMKVMYKMADRNCELPNYGGAAAIAARMAEFKGQ